MKITLTTKYIDDGISQFHNAFHTANPVLISTQTGSGKTHFIINTLIPAFLDQYGYHGADIVILSNRIALDTQIKKSISAMLEKKYPHVFSHETYLQDYQMSLIVQGEPYIPVKRKEDLPIVYSSSNCNIIILKYQQAGIMKKYLNNHKRLLIMDEVHYFLADSLFNPYTRFLKEIIAGNQTAIRVYLSATPVGISDLLKKYEAEFAHQHRLNQPAEGRMKYNYSISLSNGSTNRPVPIIPGIDNFTEISSDINYSAYDCFYFHKYEEIVLRIKETPQAEKWLVFVNKIEEGQQLCNLLTKNSVPAVFINAQNKNTKAWKKLLQENSFTAQVLIATKVLDNGFSLKNYKVNNDNFSIKHMVLPFIEEITLKQMIGRKRLDENERINLYFEIPTKQEVKSQFRSYKQMQEAIRLYESRGSQIMAYLWEKQDNRINKLFYIVNRSQHQTTSVSSEDSDSNLIAEDSIENDDLAAIEVEEQFPDPLENTNPIEVDQPAEEDDNSSSFKRPKVSSSLTKQYLFLNPQGKYFVKMLLIFYRNIVELTNHFNGDITTAYLHVLSCILDKPVPDFHSIKELGDPLTSFCLPIVKKYISPDGISAEEIKQLYTELLPAFCFLPKHCRKHNPPRFPSDVNHFLKQCVPPYIAKKRENRFYIKIKPSTPKE